MIICYHRSSSLGTLEMCEMQYYFTYVLGMKGKANKKAMLGTMTHRALQILADKKLAQQNKKRKLKNDDIRDLTFAECDDIELITQLAFDQYRDLEPGISFGKEDLETCISWMYKVLSYNGGELDPRNQNVFATEQFFDFEIQKDWAKYSYDIGGQKIEGNLAIKGTIDLIVQHEEKYFQILDYKGLPLETPILTTQGWSTMGDIKIGDIVYDRFGKQTKVVAKSKIKNKECYRLTFDDKKTVECDDEHYWTLSNNLVVQSPNLKVGMKIDVALPIENQEISLPIDPYVLGVWLGDGRNRQGEICSGDAECFNEIEKRGYSVGKNLEKRDKRCESRTIYGLTKSLKNLGLIHNKHIPEIYFKGSYQQRMDLLRGLMDSDGSVNPLRKQCVFMNRNKKLSEDLSFLLSTLGQRPYLCETKQKYKGENISCYPVFFRPINIVPFLLERKANKIEKSWGPGNSNVRKIVNIEKIGKKETQCISVDSNDSTYLCTKNLIPTHNTGKRLNWATGKEKTYNDLQKDTQLLLYYYAIKNLYPDYDFYVSIYYINDGGLFEIPFGESDYLKAENMLRQKFDYIRSVQVPRQISPTQSGFKCEKLCNFSQLLDNGKTICSDVHDRIRKEGIDTVTAELADLKKITRYQDGGGRIAKD